MHFAHLLAVSKAASEAGNEKFRRTPFSEGVRLFRAYKVVARVEKPKTAAVLRKMTWPALFAIVKNLPLSV